MIGYAESYSLKRRLIFLVSQCQMEIIFMMKLRAEMHVNTQFPIFLLSVSHQTRKFKGDLQLSLEH